MSANLVVARTQPKKKDQEISAHYVQINLRVLTHALGYDANINRNKKAVQFLDQGTISLVLKLKVHLIPKILRVAYSIFSIFAKCNLKQNIILPHSSFRDSAN